MKNVELYDFQKKAVTKILDYIHDKNDNKIRFMEIPTGHGKSVVISYVASQVTKENPAKKVIISTYTNKLVYDLYDTLTKGFDFGINKNGVKIVIGKKNYIDIDALRKLPEYLKTSLEKKINSKMIESYISGIKNEVDYLTDTFIEKMEIPDNDIRIVKDFISIGRNNNKKNYEYISSFTDGNIFITNHFYLLSYLRQNRDKIEVDLKDCVVLLDEAHALSDAAESLLLKSFSPYRLQVISQAVIGVLESTLKEGVNIRGIKTLIEKLKKLKNISKLFVKYHKNENKIGLFEEGDEKIRKIDALVKAFHPVVTAVSKSENRFLKNNKLEILKNGNDKYFTILEEEIKEFNDLAKIHKHKGEQTIELYYSPTKGYPSFAFIDGDPSRLLGLFWNQTKKVYGVSATVLTPDDDAIHTPYIYKRLNVRNKERVSVDIVLINSHFDKKNLSIYLPDTAFQLPNINKNDEGVNERWVNAVTEIVSATHGGENCMILTGSYLETDYIFNELKKKISGNILLKAERGKPTLQTISEFKKYGGILIATRNYGVGIDLKHEYLTKLYIAKLPYAPYMTKKWLDIKRKSPRLYGILYRNDMLITLRQWIGRLIRTEKDKGDLFILDGRISLDKGVLRNTVKQMCQKVGTIKPLSEVWHE